MKYQHYPPTGVDILDNIRVQTGHEIPALPSYRGRQYNSAMAIFLEADFLEEIIYVIPYM